MAGNLVVAGGSFAAGLRSEAFATYRRMYEAQKATLGLFVQMDIPSTRRTEDYFFWNSAPHIVRWPRGETVTTKEFTGIRYQALNHRWARGIEWSREDRLDDQTKSLLDQARDLGASVAQLDERVALQQITGGTDIDLLPSLPLAPDGAALFAKTAGGVSRFGAGTVGNAQGNLNQAFGGVATVAAIQTDYYVARASFYRYQDTEGQPLHSVGVVDGPAVLLFNPVNLSVFEQAFLQVLNLGTSATAMSSNLIRDANRVPVLWPTQRITNNDWYVFLTGSPIKALANQLREPLHDVMQLEENSDTARITGEEGIFFYERKGYFVHTPYAGFANKA